MKAPSFAYVKPRSLAEVLDVLEKHGEGARLLAGGQSPVATLNLRLSSPEVLIDLTGLDNLKGIVVKNNKVRIGALATHRTIELSADIQKHLPLLAQAAAKLHLARVLTGRAVAEYCSHRSSGASSSTWGSGCPRRANEVRRLMRALDPARPAIA